MTLARARRLAGLGEWEDLRALLGRALPALKHGAPLDDRLEARALLGRALVHLGRHEEAAACPAIAICAAPYRVPVWLNVLTPGRESTSSAAGDAVR